MKQPLKKIISTLPVSLQVNLYKKYRRYFNPDYIKNLHSLHNSVDEQGYSLKGYDELNCIFIRIPKCASQSVSKALFGNLGGGHRSIFEYRLVFKKEEFSKYFKFTFVRNPWDRAASAYFYHKERWPTSVFGMYPDFNSFAKGWMNQQNIYTKAAFTPQYKFICGESGKIEVDFIGYVENIEQDFLKITQKLGVEQELKTKNKTTIKKKDYRTYYNDESAEIVAQLYEKDIKMFGYDFDNSTL